MRLLLDENFPVDFAKFVLGHDVATVHSLGWAGTRNGELLRRARAVCDVFVTLDRSLEFQQNVKTFPFGVVVVKANSNRLADLLPHVASILDAATKASPGTVRKAGA